MVIELTAWSVILTKIKRVTRKSGFQSKIARHEVE